MPDDYRDLATIMIADLKAQLPMARPGQKAEILRAIARWRKAKRQPVVESKPEPKPKRKSPNPTKWALRTCR